MTDQCIHHLIATQANRTPDAMAIAAPGRAPLAYRRLRDHIEDVVATLNAMGMGRNDRVAIVLPNGPEMAVAFVAVAAGATSAPLNPAYRAHEFDFYLSDLNAKALIIQSGMDSPAMAAAQARGIPIIELSPALEAEAGIFTLKGDKCSHAARNGFAQPNDVALVLPTSGTTSRPKIVPLTQTNICTSAHNIRAALELGDSDRCLNVMPLFHIHGLMAATLSSLATGASVVCTPGFDASKFFGWLEAFRPTWYTAVPTMHQAILEHAASNRDIIAHCPLRFIRSCSAALPPKLMAELEGVFNAPVIESYGMTEAAHQMTSNPLPPRQRKPGSVGVAAGPEVAIMDEAGNLLPAGETGEIVIHGANVTQGYENNPMANESAFTKGWFRTGDQGFLDTDGYLFITSRIKEIINRGGEKIAPREVDDALMDHPAVAQAVTFAVPHATLGEDVAAAIVLRENASISEREIREFAFARLADYKVPSQMLIVDKIPKGPTGKPQRIGLAEKLAPRLKAEFVAPRNVVEDTLAGIWAEVLGIEPVGIYNNFFALGGDSLMATRLVDRVRATFRVELPLETVFREPTVADQAVVIEDMLINEIEELGALVPYSESRAIPRCPEMDSVPLSFAQERLWFLDRLQPGSSIYNIATAVRLTGMLNVTALEQSLNEIVRRHESLRTTFATIDGQPVQVITPALTLSLPIMDLCDLSETERETEARRLAAEEARRPFDLAQGPLLRATLLRLGEEEHILLLTMHHIVSDGWSRGILFRELSTLYEAFSAGKPSPLPELPIQYADFAVWQRQWLQGEVLEAQLAYWKKQLDGAPSALELPTDRPRPAVQTFRGAHQSMVLSRELTEALKALSYQEGVTLFMMLLAAFKTLLYRYTGQDDIIVGSPIANRNRVEIEGLIGFFVNTLVLRTDLSGNPSFRELLGQVREVALGAYAHQDLPFEKLAEELQPERNLSHSPLFQVMFTLQNIPRQTLTLSGLTLSSMEVDSGTAKFDLTLFTAEEAEGLRGTLEYNTDLFDATTIQRMLGHFQILLEGIVTNPDQRLSELPLLTEAERHQLLVEWNDTQADYPKNSCIHQLFETQVEQIPDAIAVVFEDQQLTYRELNARANQLAHYLRRRGVAPEGLVGICMERSLEMVVGLLGILKAGGAYVPLDPVYPRERLAFMLEDTQVPVLLTQKELLEGLPEHEAKVVCLDTNWEAIAVESVENPASEVTVDNLAYVIYTSGSTGRPKGVCCGHSGVVNLLADFESRQPLSIGDGCSFWTSLSFDVSVYEIFSALLAGGTLHIVPDLVRSDGMTFVKWLTAHKINSAYIPPFMLADLAAWLRKESETPSLHRLLVGVEPIKEQLLAEINARIPRLHIINGYGPTEATVCATLYAVQPQNAQNRNTPIGRPVQNTKIYLLDAHLQPVPVGMWGELHIGGVGLARGYLNRPDLTAEKFIPNPFSEEPQAYLYKTGDLTRYLPDGNIEFLGRLDHQVKIRGFRIELREIEAVLGRHPAVQKTVVLAREDRPGDKRLVAYVVPGQGAAPTTNTLRSFLEKKLPSYMIPSIFVFIDALPLMPNGKIDRQALPAPDIARPGLEEAFVAPRDTLELQLMKIWEQVLGLQPIGVRDNFFELGGHSLLAVRLFAQIEKVFGKSLPLATLFQAPTVERLASVLRQAGWSAPWSSLVAIQPGGSKPPFFCVPGNLGNVFTDLGDLARHLGPDQPFYGFQDGIQNPIQIEALAAHYLDEIRVVQPEGPYLLGGVCSGGVVAFEMAQQLQAQGQKVALLTLVEPSHPPVPGLPAYFNLLVSILRRVVHRSGHHSRNFSQHSSTELRTYAHLKAKLVANMWALACYAPQTYPGQIHLFLADEMLAKSSHDPRLGWQELAAGGAEIHMIPGTHDAITRTYDAVPEESHLQVLAEQLRACIDEALKDDYSP